MKITKVHAREIYDAQGWPTVACEITLENGTQVTSSAPSYSLLSSNDTRETRDGGNRLWGQGAVKASAVIEEVIAPLIMGKVPHAIEMDVLLSNAAQTQPTLGVNSLLAASMSIYKAHAAVETIQPFELIAYICGAKTVSLPFPLFVIARGRERANIMVAPLGAPDFRSAIEVGMTLYHMVYQNKRYEENARLTVYSEYEETLSLISEALAIIETDLGVRCGLALDMKASDFYDSSTQRYTILDEPCTSLELATWYEKLTHMYPIYSIEDGLADDDWQGWQLLMEKFGDKVQIVANQMCESSVERMTRVTEGLLAHAVTIQPIQIGTVTQTLQTVGWCQQHNLVPLVATSWRETEETFLADLAVGVSCGQFKAGALAGSEWITKYNRLLTIEDILSLSLLGS